MRIIDRYLLRQFVQVFLICFISFDGIYVVADVLSNLDEFLHYAETEGTLFGIIVDFYSYRSIFMFERISSMLTMISGMFTVTWIQRHNEMTALTAAGVPRARVVRPVIVAAAVISLLTCAGRELVIPPLAKKLDREPKNLRGDNGEELRPRYDNETNVLMQGRVTFANEARIQDPSFVLPEELNQYGKQLSAANAYYQGPQGDRPGGYLFKGVTSPPRLLQSPSLAVKGKPIVMTPLDQPRWLKSDECFLASNVSFTQLSGGHGWRTFSSTRELIAGLSNPSLGLAGDFGADVRVAIHSRVVQPLLDMTLLFLGLPLVMHGTNRNVFLAIGLCGLVCTAFMVVVMASQYLGQISLIRPALAAWVPLIIFVPVAVGMYERIEH
ncbi:MAG TPA: LptF/LptG family permease [Pirellulales bacterium]|jgi:lipopolysaccharide export system permease protein|nr:LptF/LptG family permease [Pirellulales bacterium]